MNICNKKNKLRDAIGTTLIINMVYLQTFNLAAALKFKLFYLIDCFLLRHTQECFIYTTVASIMVEGKHGTTLCNPRITRRLLAIPAILIVFLLAYFYTSLSHRYLSFSFQNALNIWILITCTTASLQILRLLTISLGHRAASLSPTRLALRISRLSRRTSLGSAQLRSFGLTPPCRAAVPEHGQQDGVSNSRLCMNETHIKNSPSA